MFLFMISSTTTCACGVARQLIALFISRQELARYTNLCKKNKQSKQDRRGGFELLGLLTIYFSFNVFIEY
jgi:hypothetical protein